MPLSPVHRRSVPEEVVDQLTTAILSGELRPGTALPAERRLAETLGVSRPAVREALQRLGQTGLIEVRQGEVTLVRDHRLHAGPELLGRLLERDGVTDPQVVRDLVEARVALAPDIARRCAMRRPEPLLAELEAFTDEMADVAHDRQALHAAARRFWNRVVDGSDNVAYRLLWNSLERVPLSSIELVADAFDLEVADVDGHRAITEAVAVQDGSKAAAAARRLVGQGARRVLARLG